MSVRIERVASMIKEEVGILFQRNFSMEQYGFLTVTDVKVTPDLKQAKIFVSIFGDAARKTKTLGLLEEQKGFVRSTLARNLRTRSVPAIVFELDETIDNAMRLEEIFRKIHDERDSSEQP